MSSSARREAPVEHEEPELVALRERLSAEREAHRATQRRLEAAERACAGLASPRMLRLLGAHSIADLRLGHHDERRMTILFADIRDFTSLSETMSAHACFDFINSYLHTMEPLIAEHGGVVDKYIGDAIMALFPDAPDGAVRAGLAMLAAVRTMNDARAGEGAAPLRIGIGLNTGIVSLGTLGGPTHMENTVLGDAVNLGARLESATKTYGTPLVIGESTLYGLADARRYAIRFVDRIRVKGKRHPESVYEVFDGDAPTMREGKLGTRKLFEEAAAYYHVKAIPRAIPLLERCVASVPTDLPARMYLDRCHEFLATGRHEGTGELDGTLAWSDDYLVGIDAIDAQHRELLGLISRLGEQVHDCEPGGRSEALSFLGTYAIKHFSFEEELMKRHAYPLRAEHLHAHRVFGRYFREVQREMDEGTHDPLYLAFRVQVFLVDWFVNHTTKTDRHLAKFLRQRQAGPNP